MKVLGYKRRQSIHSSLCIGTLLHWCYILAFLNFKKRLQETSKSVGGSSCFNAMHSFSKVFVSTVLCTSESVLSPQNKKCCSFPSFPKPLSFFRSRHWHFLTSHLGENHVCFIWPTTTHSLLGHFTCLQNHSHFTTVACTCIVSEQVIKHQ